MGLLDSLRAMLGTSAETDATRAADPDDLFGMSTAYLTMAADLGFDPSGEAALCFSNVDSASFEQAEQEVKEILEAGREETGTEASFNTDSHGYQWVILEDPEFEDLITSMHFAADTFVEKGFGSRLLAAVFAFEKDSPVYWVYSFRRGSYYPFAPQSGHERDSTTEFKLQSTLDGELDVEDETDHWYPLWPDGRGHPWE
ncbi:PspA-associated protein PspAB [Halocatena halophila]|uniref:PspA-associated protein PspAB n=1 Tax=Halocatena halophila TaxID=2814576 RepID=UPI002ED47343